MKKTGIVLISLLLILISGCGKKETPKPDPTPTPNANAEVTPTPIPSEQPSAEKMDLSGKEFVEDVKDNATVIRFLAEGTFKITLNVCSGMGEFEGTYTGKDDMVTLSFDTETGFDFLDKQKTFDFFVDGKTLTYSGGEMFSCAGSDVYKEK